MSIKLCNTSGTNLIQGKRDGVRNWVSSARAVAIHACVKLGVNELKRRTRIKTCSKKGRVKQYPTTEAATTVPAVLN